MRISDWSSDVCSSDLDVSADFLDYVQRFAWLRDLSSVAPRAQAAPIAENLMRRWLQAHADTIADPAWRPDLCARRSDEHTSELQSLMRLSYAVICLDQHKNRQHDSFIYTFLEFIFN